jgi:hypothetical protein
MLRRRLSLAPTDVVSAIAVLVDGTVVVGKAEYAVPTSGTVVVGTAGGLVNLFSICVSEDDSLSSCVLTQT